MTRALLVAALGLAACFDPHYGAAPFACENGACPSGYRCAQALCIADDAPDPPILVGETTNDAPLPHAVRGDDAFAVFWQDNVEGSDMQSSLHLTRLDGSAITSDASLVSVTGSAAFDALYDASANEYVFAITTNPIGSPTLQVDTIATDGTNQQQVYAKTEMVSPIGFSAPSLAVYPMTSGSTGNEVTLAYTFASPPAIDKDNVYCTRINLHTMTNDSSCTPTVAQTMGEYAVDVSVAEIPNLTTLFWRSGDIVYSSQMSNGAPVATRTVNGVTQIGHVASIASTIALTEEEVMGSSLSWNVAVHKGSSSLDQAVSNAAEPDITSDGQRLILCLVGDDGEIEVYLRSLTDLSVIGSPIPVPRLSNAAIEGCRVAASLDSTEVAVAWKELVPPSVGRIYVTTLQLPPS